MLIDFVTVFPEMFAPLELSIIGRAKEKGLVGFRYFNPRDYTEDPHRKVDDTQFGGSDGLVMAAPPLIDATEAALKTGEGEKKKLLLTSPQGQPFTQAKAKADRAVVMAKATAVRYAAATKPGA